MKMPTTTTLLCFETVYSYQTPAARLLRLPALQIARVHSLSLIPCQRRPPTATQTPLGTTTTILYRLSIALSLRTAPALQLLRLVEQANQVELSWQARSV